MLIECAWCTPVEEHNPEASHGICGPCFEKQFAMEFPLTKGLSGCKNCLDKNLKCQFFACPELSAKLDDIDRQLKEKGIIWLKNLQE